MAKFTVVVQIEGDSADGALSRVSSWGLRGVNEGVLSIMEQPELIEVPTDLLPGSEEKEQQ